MSVKFEVKERKDYTIMEFSIEGGVITPDELRELQIPQANPRKGVIISGRGPLWLYGVLFHHYHPTRWVGCYDPRLGGAVVVQTHSPEVKIGDIIPVEG